MKSSFILYGEWERHFALLSPEQQGALAMALFAYNNRDEIYEGDPAVSMAFSFIKSAMDENDAKWERERAAKAEAGRAGGLAKASKSSSAKQSQKKSSKSSLSVSVSVSDSVSGSVSVSGSPSETNEGSPPAAEPTPASASKRHKFGQYGWVSLTDEEHSRLLNDLGETEFKRCVAYVDESAQATGNKNKWRDWNLVIRKCSRDGWGAGPAQKKAPQEGNPFLRRVKEMEKRE